ncbi:MAG: hypothetical protein NWQ09_10150 [Nonlabens sp.]|nr:hypothetical protein [Nonlabens sp.]MDP5101679.1 hypothetical protein [Nonlabens sp.]
MNFYVKSFLVIFAIALVIFGAHSLMSANPAFSLIKMYAFIAAATFASVSALKFAHQVAANQIALVYLATMMVKMGLAIVIFPQLIDDSLRLSKLQLLEFLVPYFLFLGLEALVVVKWLNKPEVEA